MERVFNMIFRKLMNKGINSGIRAASKRGGDTPQEGASPARHPKQNAKGLRMATRLLRRIAKF